MLAQTQPCDLLIETDLNRTGCGPALNRALGRVTSTWMMGLADDDSLCRTAAQCLSEQDQFAAMVIFQMRDPDGIVLPNTTNPDELAMGMVGASYAIKTEVAREIGFLDVPSSGERPEDWEMITEVRARGLPIVIVPEVQVIVKGPE